ncbi:hypothetical protein B0W81_02355 [Prochlorococcus sp. HOT_208_60]|nr:hypothetical protein B0W81_02355 [Prochlorococcus sp. HOT_208_60]
MRNTLLKTISEKIISDEKLIVILGDLGVFQMKDAMKKYPSRVLNFGIMEQTMIGFSAGISRGDYYPIIYSITPFIVDRAYEQIKLDLIYNKNNALILSAGASFDYSTLGPTHHCPHDISNLLSIGHPFLCHPFTKIESIGFLNYILQKKIQAYLRISTSELDISKYKNFVKFDLNEGKNYLEKIEKYNSNESNRSKKLLVLFGPDSILLKDCNKHIKNSDSLIKVSVLNEDVFLTLSEEIKKFEEVFLAIPYEPSQIIFKLIGLIKSFKNNPKSILVLHPRTNFYDNSYQKEDIFQKYTEETRIF